MGQTVVAGFSTHPDWDHGVVMQAQPTVRHEDYWPALSELQQKITARLEEKGVSVAEMQAQLLAKVEELTLHMIQADERNNRLEQQNRELRARMARLETRAATQAAGR